MTPQPFLLANRLLSLLRQVAAVLVWILVAAAFPFYAFPDKARWPGVLFLPIAGLMAWFKGARWRPSLPHTPLNRAFLLLGSMVLISAWASYDLAISLPKLAGMALGVSVFFTAAGYSASRMGQRIGAGLLGLGGLGVAVLGLAGTQWSVSEASSKVPVLYSWIARLPVQLRGMPGASDGFNPNEVGGVLLWVILPVLGAVVSEVIGWRVLPDTQQANVPQERPRHKVLAWVGRVGRALVVSVIGFAALALLVTVLTLTQSRSAYAGLALATLLFLLLVLPLRAQRWVWGLGIGVVLGLGLLLGPSLPGFFASLAHVRKVEITPFFTTVSLAARVRIWEWAATLIRDFPLTGIGMNTFRHMVPLMFSPQCLGSNCDLGHAHNEALQTALDLGIPGLVAISWIYLGAFWMLARLYCQSIRDRQTGLRFWVLGLGGGLLAHLVYGLADAVALGARPGILLWLLLGLVAGLYRAMQPSSQL